MRELPLTPELLLAAYANGYFPMARSRDDHELGWCNPDMRALLPLNPFHVPRSLVKFMRKQPFEITCDRAFPQVIAGCAEQRPEREDTWINADIIALYTQLSQIGFAHSVECWSNGRLAGGLYGVAIGGAFFGESMFSRVPGASKVALVYLAQGLEKCGYKLLDAQFANPHLQQFGLQEISRQDYLVKLREALQATPKASCGLWHGGR